MICTCWSSWVKWRSSFSSYLQSSSSLQWSSCAVSACLRWDLSYYLFYSRHHIWMYVICASSLQGLSRAVSAWLMWVSSYYWSYSRHHIWMYVIFASSLQGLSCAVSACLCVILTSSFMILCHQIHHVCNLHNFYYDHNVLCQHV